MRTQRKTKVINLLAGPGVGKSTTMSGLFFEMKQAGMSCEIAPEFAKELVWEERHNFFPYQDYLFAEQRRRLSRLVGKVDYIITDSPILLSVVYMPDEFPWSFRKFVFEMFNMYSNFNVLLTRVKPYDPNGRNQDLAGSEKIQHKIVDLIDELKLPHIVVSANREAPVEIFRRLDLSPKVT